MKKVFIIHGFKAGPNDGWIPWLICELAKNDIWACALAMPTPDIPNKDEWVRAIKEAVKNPTDEIFLIGHSLGVPAILRYLETITINSKISGAVLVSGPIFKKENGNKYITVFLNDDFSFKQIKNVCNNFIVIHGSDDPNVPFSDAEYLSEKLSCDLICIKNGGHLAGYNGWIKLPEALESLLKMIKFNHQNLITRN